VSDFFTAYCELISSPVQLAQCRQAKSLTDLLQVIKFLWGRPAIDDRQLLVELNQLNQKIINDESVRLAGHWLPYAYHAKSRSIHWCLTEGHATEPFQDEYISRCRQKILLNQIVQPRTSLDGLSFQYQSQFIAKVQPAGFIFHLSRCGSTLVSGCFSELDSSCIFSESPVLTSILLDDNLTSAQQQTYLQQLIDLQAGVFPERTNIIVKWNAWDIFRWDLIRTIYPKVPVLFLVRNPLDILASHQRSVGRHMSGDLSMVAFHPVFSMANKTVSLLDYRIHVLQSLLFEMRQHYSQPEVRFLDYRLMNAESMVDIAHHFNLQIKPIEYSKMQERMRFHSKKTDQLFHTDYELQPFNQQECEHINKSFLSIYHQLPDSIHQFRESFYVG
jgi:hypothetical protein